jgi:flagellin-like protein
MKTLRKIRKNAKALSPVVASIILIAVTVAVSIAVAAWMGALTVGFMATEELKITSMSFNVPAGTITLIANNTGTTPVTINEVWVNNVRQTSVAFTPSTGTANANTGLQVVITYSGLAYGSNYAVKMVSAKGNTFMYTATAPS